MQANEREKLFHTTIYIAQKVRPFSDFEINIDLQRINGVDFNLTGHKNKRHQETLSTVLWIISLRVTKKIIAYRKSVQKELTVKRFLLLLKLFR